VPNLASADFQNPLLWALLIGWIISVILHEFAHGLVAHLGGDYTIRERGGLSLNPIQYVDPVFSLIIPAVILLMGGIPLPGGVTYIRRDLLRSRNWDTAVSLAGPAMNIVLFLACAIPLHPRIGWINPAVDVAQWSNVQVFLAAMAILQLTAAVLNLIPVPPLDGFQALGNYLPPQIRDKVGNPPVSTFAFFVYFMILWNGGFGRILLHVFLPTMQLLGFDNATIIKVVTAWGRVF